MEIWYKCCVLDVDRSRLSCFSCKYHPFILMKSSIWFDTMNLEWLNMLPHLKKVGEHIGFCLFVYPCIHLSIQKILS